MADIRVTEFWLDKNLDRAEFEAAFAAEFPGGAAKQFDRVENARPGY